MLKKLKQVTLSGLKNCGAFTLVRESKWRQGRLLILSYHGVSLEDEHEWDPDLFMSPAYFRARLEILKKLGCNLLPLDEALQRLYTNDLPENCVALTFDDGHYNFYKEVHPLLKEFNFPSTLYLTTFYVHYNRPVIDSILSYLLWKGRDATLNLQEVIGQEGKFGLSNKIARNAAYNCLIKYARQRNFSAEENDALAAKLASQLRIDYEALCAKRILHLLSAAEVRQLAAEGVDIQLHTHRHCLSFNRELFNQEIAENRINIQGITGASSTHLCYPGGIYSEVFFPWLEQMNVRSATTCEPGFATRDTNRFLLPRLVDHSSLSPIEFESWLTGVAASLPRRHKTYNNKNKPPTFLEEKGLRIGEIQSTTANR